MQKRTGNACSKPSTLSVHVLVQSNHIRFPRAFAWHNHHSSCLISALAQISTTFHTSVHASHIQKICMREMSPPHSFKQSLLTRFLSLVSHYALHAIFLRLPFTNTCTPKCNALSFLSSHKARLVSPGSALGAGRAHVGREGQTNDSFHAVSHLLQSFLPKSG